MPTIPSVFRSIRPNDVQFRPFKAYKNYTLNNVTPAQASASGYFAYNAIYQNTPPHLGDPDNLYASNSIDNRNQQVVWKQIDHKHYRHPYDPARCDELYNRRVTRKSLFTSASVLTAPYVEVGERIKPNSVSVTANSITLTDDGYGNLCDAAINTSSMMLDDDLKLYISFNEAYRLTQSGTGIVNGSLKYELRRADAYAVLKDVTITDGVTVASVNSGLSALFDHPGTSSIRIPHNDVFDRMNACDDWTLSFWTYIPNDTDSNHVLFSKFAVTPEQQLDKISSKIITADKIITPPSDIAAATYAKYRRPFDCYIQHQSSTAILHFRISDGTFQRDLRKTGITEGGWYHVAVINNGATQTVSLYVDGTLADSAIMPPGTTTNKADIIFGSTNLSSTNAADGHRLAEFRLYETSASAAQLATLADDSSATTAKLYQTNVAGNVFYRNGQIVVSSPLPKYNITNGGFFNSTFTATYKGQHTIYENEVMVRVPADSLNVSMNPSATYRPPAGETELCATGQSNRPPGELRKTMFTNGTALPYISTIGLYNDQNQLLAIGKFAQPIQKRDDVDMNFIIRWDY